jgi:hypothetical protein
VLLLLLCVVLAVEFMCDDLLQHILIGQPLDGGLSDRYEDKQCEKYS